MLKGAKEVPWSEPVELAWNFQAPLVYEVRSTTQMIIPKGERQMESQGTLRFEPHNKGATLSYQSPNQSFSVLVDRHGTDLSQDTEEPMLRAIRAWFPSAPGSLRPGEARTREVKLPLTVEKTQGWLEGETRTKLQRAWRVGDETLLELHVDIELNKLGGFADPRELREGSLRGKATTYYATRARRFVFGSCDVTSTIVYNKTPTGEFMEAMYGSFTLRTESHYEYTLKAP